MTFIKEHYLERKAQNPDIKYKDCFLEYAKLWNTLSEQEKNEYKEKSL